MHPVHALELAPRRLQLSASAPKANAPSLDPAPAGPPASRPRRIFRHCLVSKGADAIAMVRRPNTCSFRTERNTHIHERPSRPRDACICSTTRHDRLAALPAYTRTASVPIEHTGRVPTVAVFLALAIPTPTLRTPHSFPPSLLAQFEPQPITHFSLLIRMFSVQNAFRPFRCFISSTASPPVGRPMLFDPWHMLRASSRRVQCRAVWY